MADLEVLIPVSTWLKTMLDLVAALLKVSLEWKGPALRRRVLHALVAVALMSAGLVGLWFLLYGGQKKTAPVTEYAVVETCSELEVSTRVPEYPNCAAEAYAYTKGVCRYPDGVLGVSGRSKDEEIRAFCAKLALMYDYGPRGASRSPH